MIHKVAYMQVCPECGLHATIVLPDGSQTEEFASVKQGLEVVCRLFACELIEADELRFLREQVQQTELAGIDLPPKLFNTVEPMPAGMEDFAEVHRDQTLH
jgi:hypothetical protein